MTSVERHLLAGYPVLTEREALQLSPLKLAYMGDAVHDLLVRTGLVLSGIRVGEMHRGAVRHVNARAQAQALSRIVSLLSETESDVVRRGRNAHAHHGVPRRVSAAEYCQATGLEALLGFLYLTGKRERLLALFHAMNETLEDVACPE